MTPFETVQIFAKTLDNLEKWIDKAEETAKSRGFDVDVLAQSRLAPDQYGLVQQVQSACDQAKYAAAYLGGVTPPSHPDTEKTTAELRERIRTATAFVASVKESAYAGADERKVAPNWLGGRWLTGADYLACMAVPNFYFHATMAYAILRHNGVPLGKMDFIASMPVREA
jgi:hypothetical protein